MAFAMSASICTPPDLLLARSAPVDMSLQGAHPRRGLAEGGIEAATHVLQPFDRLVGEDQP